MIPLGILTGILAVAAALLAWRLLGLTGERTAALKARDEAKVETDQVRKDSKSARDELESKRRELSSLQAEHKGLKKKLYDSKGEVRRRGGRTQQDDDEQTPETRIRELNAALERAREEIGTANKIKEQAEKSLTQAQNLRDRIAALEAERVTLLSRRPEKTAPAPEAAPAAEEEAHERRFARRHHPASQEARGEGSGHRIPQA